MPGISDITNIKVTEEFHTCPSCGYDLGFQTSFISMNFNKDTPVKSTRDVFRVILICPSCRARFDVGWIVTFTEFESRFVKTVGMPKV